MKKIILASAVVSLIALGATAQRNTNNRNTSSTRTTASSRTNSYSSEGSTGLANTILLYGVVGFSSSKPAIQDAKSTSSLLFNPGVGYQFNNNWAVGLQATLQTTKTPVNADDFNHLTDFEVGPFLRYTHSLSNIFNVYGQLDLGITGSRDKTDNVDPVGKSAGFLGRIYPAISINVKNNFMLNFAFGGLSFETDKVKDADESQTDINFNFGQQFNFGVSKNF
jgi:hypothetical protein